MDSFYDILKALKDVADEHSTSPEKARDWLVKLGTHNPDGSLTENYDANR